MLVPHPGRQLGFRQRNRGGRYGFWWWCRLRGRGDLPEAGPVAGDGLGGVPGEVVPQGAGRPPARCPPWRVLFRRPPARTAHAIFTAHRSPVTTTPAAAVAARGWSCGRTGRPRGSCAVGVPSAPPIWAGAVPSCRGRRACGLGER